jgi:hydroxypyruvate isomerase
MLDSKRNEMPRFAANLTMLFNEVPFMERFGQAAMSGFKGVEFLFPYAYSAADIKYELKRNDLNLVLHNLPPGDWDAGERGIACLPDRVDEFRSGVQKAIDYAIALEVPQLNCLAGKAAADIDPKVLHNALISNLKYATSEFHKVGLRLLIEPINTFDIPDFFLSKTQQTIEILQEVGADNLFIQYDIYHAQRMEGELSKTIENNLAKIAHFQIADNPGRNEPGTGEINYDYLFKLLDRLGYMGWIGCEYKPLTNTQNGLNWISTYQ